MMVVMVVVVALEMMRTTEIVVTMQEEETAEQILFMLFGPRIWEHNGQCCRHLFHRRIHHLDKN